MSLKAKSFFTIFLGALFSFFILIFLSYFFILKEFEQVEIFEAKLKLTQLQEILKEKLFVLSEKSSDWAFWDDAYYFVQNKNFNFIKSNLTNETFSQTKWNFIIFLNKKKEVVYKKGFDFFLKKDLQVDDKEILNILEKDNSFSQVKEYEKKIVKFTTLNHQLTAISLLPILKSDGSGPLAGYLITGYFFDDDRKNDMTKVLQTEMIILPYSQALIEFSKLSETVLKENDFLVARLNFDKLVNYLIVKEGEKPIFVFKFYLPRLIFQQALRTIISFLFTYLALGFLVILFYYHFIYSFILKRLTKILERIQEINEKKDFSLRINDLLKDEFGVLARNFDQLLENLKEKASKLEKQNKELEDLKKALFAALESEKEAKESVEKKVEERTNELMLLNQRLNENWLRLKYSIESLPLGFILISPDHKIILANQKVREILEIGKEEKLNCERIMMMFSYKVDLFSSCQLASFKKQPVKINEIEFKDKFLKMKFIPVLDSKNQVMNTIFLVEDVTEERKMQKQIEELNLHLEEKVKEKTKEIEKNIIDLKKFKLAVDKASDMIVILDDQRKILYANFATEKITGFGKKELLDKKVDEFLFLNLKEEKKVEEIFNDVKNKKIPLKVESLNKRKNQTPYVAEITISPIFDKKDNLKYFVVIGRDVTLEKEADRMKSEFISLASHQLKTPLSSIRWLLDLLLTGEVGSFSKKQLEILSNIDKANKIMIEIVDSLLNISRIESGRIIIEPILTDVKKIIEEVKKEVEEKLKEKEQKLIIKVEKNLPKILVDPRFLREVYINLLTNAIKYSPPGKKIEVIVKKEKNEILSAVKDYGYGIPKNEKEKVFTKFFRGSNVVKKVTEGTGLGLYLTKIIVEKAGGRIWFESEEEKGTTFYFTLPLSGMKRKEGEVYLS
jgi:PAS domain S-box-containing protein